MKSLWQLFYANLKMALRNKQALFWMLAFPIIFLTIFGLFDMDKLGGGRMIIIDEANTQSSQQIVDGFKAVDAFNVEQFTSKSDLDGALQQLKDDNTDFVLVIPEDLKNIPSPEQAQAAATQQLTSQAALAQIKPVDLEVYYNEANLTTNQIVFSVLSQITTQINAKASGAPDLINLKEQPITDKKVRYIDFLMPGIVAMSLMQSAIIGIAVFLTEAREKKILKRILATPVDRRAFIAAQVLSRLVLSFMQAIIIIVTARILYDVQIFGSYWTLFIWALLGTLVFLLIGFIIASFSKTTNAAESLSQVISMPMLFLSGVFFSTDSLPTVVQKIVDYLPLTPVIDALRKVAIDGKPFSATMHDFWIVAAWLVVTFVVALFSFRTARD